MVGLQAGPPHHRRFAARAQWPRGRVGSPAIPPPTLIRPLAGLALVLAACAHAPALPELRVAGPEALSERGPLAVGCFELALARGERALPSTVWYPEGPAPSSGWPLIIYSHGFMSSRLEGVGLYAHLASHGYVVLAADYPNTSLASKDPTLADVANQPADVTFLLDAALALNAQPGSALFGRIDPHRLGAAGLSLGGLTTLLVAFHPALRDPRIAAAVALAAPTESLNPVFFSHASVPLLAVYGTADAVIDFGANALTLPAKAPAAWMARIDGACHTAFADLTQYFAFFLRNPDTLGCWALKGHLPPPDVDPFAALQTEGGDVEAPLHPHLPCTATHVRRAMRPVEQQALTRALVYGFFESRLGADPAQRQGALAALDALRATQRPLHLMER
jgi:predicted dienelactone hydrolase